MMNMIKFEQNGMKGDVIVTAMGFVGNELYVKLGKLTEGHNFIMERRIEKTTDMPEGKVYGDLYSVSIDGEEVLYDTDIFGHEKVPSECPVKVTGEGFYKVNINLKDAYCRTTKIRETVVDIKGATGLNNVDGKETIQLPKDTILTLYIPSSFR